MMNDLWSTFGELFFFAGLLLAVAAIIGWKVRPSERAASALGGVALALVTAKYVVTLTTATGRDLELLGVGLIWVSFVITFWRRKNAGPAA